MFKKSLAALAVLSLTAGYASAANVVLYGSVDDGFKYSHSKTNTNGESVNTHTFELESGISTASKFGLKGSEELGNGLTVGFKLENGFSADDGKLGQEGRLFGREAALTVSGDFGALSFGRMGGLGSAAGTYDIVYGIGDAYDGGDVVFGFAASDRYDNMVTYQTPTFAGLQATFQYSFNVNTKDEDTKDVRENSSGVDRYAAAALTGEFGALQTVVAYEFQNYHSIGTNAKDTDGHTVYVGANYDFEVARLFAMGQYFKGLSDVTFGSLEDVLGEVAGDGVKGYSLHVGTIVPVAGGDFTAGLYYSDTKADTGLAENVDGKYYGVNVKYEYPISKRSSVYAGAGYAKAKQETSVDTVKVDEYAGYFGLTHNF